MKKLILLSSLLILLSFGSFAQISFDTTYHEKLDAHARDFDYRFEVRLTNESKVLADSFLNWELTKIDLPSEWDYIIRPDEECGYLPPHTSGSFILGASKEFDQYIYFTFYNQAGTGTIHFAVSSNLNPEYNDTAIFMINAKDLASTYKPTLLDFTVYPNPTSDYLTIQTEPGASYTLTNLQGQIVKEGTTITATSQINVKDLPQGTYFLKVQYGDKLGVKRVVIE